MEIALIPSADTFLAGEDLLVEVTVRNPGPDPVEVPTPGHRLNGQPTYVLTGPEHPNGLELSFRSCLQPPLDPDPTHAEAVLVSLGSGDGGEFEIPLHDWVPLREPGRYRLEAQLTWGAIDVRSTPVEFELVEPSWSGFALSHDLGQPGTARTDTFHLGASGALLVEISFGQDGRDPGVLRQTSLLRRGVQPTAGAPLPSLRNDGRPQIVSWSAWRGGDRVYASPLPDVTPPAWDLSPDQAVVPPALMSAEADLDVLCLAPDRLELVRFACPAIGEQVSVTPPSSLWTVALDSPWTGATCTLRDQRRVVLLWGARPEGLALGWLDAGHGSQPGPLCEWIVAGVRPVPNLIGAIDPAADRAWVFCEVPSEQESDPFQLACVELDLESDADPQPRHLLALESPPLAGAAAYPTPEPGDEEEPAVEVGQPIWRVLDDQGRLWSGEWPGPAKLPGAPVRPLQLLATAGGSYLLMTDPATGCWLA